VLTVESCAGLGTLGGVDVDEFWHLEQDGGLTCSVYVGVAVYTLVACFVVVEGEDGVENEDAEEAE